MLHLHRFVWRNPSLWIRCFSIFVGIQMCISLSINCTPKKQEGKIEGRKNEFRRRVCIARYHRRYVIRDDFDRVFISTSKPEKLITDGVHRHLHAHACATARY